MIIFLRHFKTMTSSLASMTLGVLEDNVTLSVTVVTENGLQANANIALSEIEPISGNYITLDTDNVISIKPWRNTPMVGTPIAMCYSIESDYIIMAFDRDDSIITCNQVITEVDDVKQYLRDNYITFKTKNDISVFKRTYIKDFIDPHASCAMLEAQLDFVTMILLDIVSQNPELMNKYPGLHALRNVSVDTLKPFDVDKIAAEKQLVRDVQVKYYKFKETLTQTSE